MACCGPEQTYFDKKLLDRLRSIKNLDIDMKLKSEIKGEKNNKNFECKFDGNEVKWNGNINELYNSFNYENEEDNAKIREKKQKINKLELELENLEKEYLAKTVRLLYMAQTHCQIKTENEKLFEQYGIKTGNVFLNSTDGLKNSSNINYGKEEEKQKKELVPA